MNAIAIASPAQHITSTISPLSTLSFNMAHDLHDRRMSSANEGLFTPTAIILRKLPRNTTAEAVRTMLLFAKDLQDTEIVPNEFESDKGFVTAVARFSSITGASEAQTMLDGKPNTLGEANMLVELLPSSSFANTSLRRNTIDPSVARNGPQAVSPPGKSSRFNSTFHNIDRTSPPVNSVSPDNIANGVVPFQSVFSSQSPRNSALPDRSRMSGKLVIGENGVDEETDGLLNNPIAYMQKDPVSLGGNGRKGGSRGLPVNAFANLSLNTNMSGPATQQYGTPRSALLGQTPHTPFSPGGGQFQNTANQYLRHNYPPVNPADQNPPCNTLYVGNLPMDTSEDELKAMFSKQRGFKRLCFRTKQNGPMCFVEFEDISFATKALNELYGAQLHNSVKGGIRLSFSKNPLGVRSGQPGSNTNPATPLSVASSGFGNGMSALSPGAFSTASGPPPGLSAPPGYGPSAVNNVQFGGFSIGMSGVGPAPSRGTSTSANQGGGGFPDYMYGR